MNDDEKYDDDDLEIDLEEYEGDFYDNYDNNTNDSDFDEFEIDYSEISEYERAKAQAKANLMAQLAKPITIEPQKPAEKPQQPFQRYFDTIRPQFQQQTQNTNVQKQSVEPVQQDVSVNIQNQPDVPVQRTYEPVRQEPQQPTQNAFVNSQIQLYNDGNIENEAEEDECPSCFCHIEPEDKVCKNCGFDLEKFSNIRKQNKINKTKENNMEKSEFTNEIEKEKMKKNYIYSDRSLKTYSSFVWTLVTIATIIFVLIGIVNSANCTDTVTQLKEGYNYTYEEVEVFNSGRFATGIAFLIGGPIISIIIGKLLMVIAWYLFDIKVIRTMVTNSEFSNYLKNFSSQKKEIYDTEEDDTNEEKYDYENNKWHF